jgi:hypothetical protein
MNSEQAADYCGVKDRKYFLKLTKVYGIPRYGHINRMFDRLNLDQWVANPKCFRSQHSATTQGRRGGFVPIHHTLMQTPGESEPEDREDNTLPTDDEL